MRMSPKGFSPTASWTSNRNADRLEEHDFSNLLQDFKYAVGRDDQTMMEYCEGELMRMFREKKATSRRVARTKR